MHPIAIELPFMATAAAIMASIVLIGGRSIEVPARPIVLPNRPAKSATDDVDSCLEAPVTAPSASGIVGQATLCYDGRDLRATLLVNSLDAGEIYTGWLSYTLPLAPCRDSPCGSIDLPSASPAGLLEQIGGSVAPSSRTLDIHGELHDVRLVSGATVTLMLLRPHETGSPHAQAVFTLP